jgi:hypothetical protein
VILVSCFILFIAFKRLHSTLPVPNTVAYPPLKNFTPDHLVALELIWPPLSTKTVSILEPLDTSDPDSPQFYV